MATVPRKRPARRQHKPETETVETKVVNNLDKTAREVTASNKSRTQREGITDPAHVTVGGKLTKNLGYFESAQVTVSLTLPCEMDDAGLDAAYMRASAWVETKIEEELAKV